MNLRPYQLQAVCGIRDQWQGCNSTLAVLCTGGGKTVIAGHVIAERLTHGRAMFLAHREELIWQAADKVRKIAGVEPAIEMAAYRADLPMYQRSPVVISTVQTQYSGNDGDGRMASFDPFEFATLIVDEAHHYVAPAFKRVIDYYRKNPNLKVLGITATPDRADEAAMGKIFETVAFEYGILEGINDGWLVSIDQQMVHVAGLDLTNIHTTAGDLNGAELAEVMEREAMLHQIASPVIDIVGDRKTLVFAASVAHAERLAEIFNRHRAGCAKWVCGETPKEVRRQMFVEYARGQFQILCNVGVATEGFDDPGVEVVVMARPTKSRSLYCQCIGRGTRPLPGIVDRWDQADDRRVAIAESDKPAVLILDLVGNSGKHKLISTADILGGDYEDEVIEAAAQKAKEADGKVDMKAALEESLRELHEKREREKEAEAARRAGLRVKAQFTKQSVDPFDVFQIEPKREHGWDTGKTITDKMRGLLEKQGIETEGLSYGKARQLLNEIFRRWDAKECSFKQAKLLKRYGLNPNVSRDEAKATIDKIAANGWRMPADLAAPVAEVEVF